MFHSEVAVGGAAGFVVRKGSLYPFHFCTFISDMLSAPAAKIFPAGNLARGEN